MKFARIVELAATVAFLVVILCPELAHARTWWFALMKGSQEGAKRCGQVALLAERRYRAEVSH